MSDPIKLHPETTPAWFCAKTPTERMIEEVEEVLNRAAARSEKDFPEARHPTACLAGAWQADLGYLQIIINSFRSVHGGEELTGTFPGLEKAS